MTLYSIPGTATLYCEGKFRAVSACSRTSVNYSLCLFISISNNLILLRQYCIYFHEDKHCSGTYVFQRVLGQSLFDAIMNVFVYEDFSFHVNQTCCYVDLVWGPCRQLCTARLFGAVINTSCAPYFFAYHEITFENNCSHFEHVNKPKGSAKQG